MIILNQIAMGHGSRILFTDVSLKLNKNQRYALVGANGTGKSTLLKLVAGSESPSDGSIAIPKNTTMGWLKQDQFKYENTRILDVVLQGKPNLWAANQEKEELLTSPEYTEQIGYRLAELEEIIAHYDGYTAETTAINMLIGLGVAAEYHQKSLSILSGGYKLRVLLAQTLFANPDILLLDEPTNHLDILSIAWLEKYLKSEFCGLLVFISHDVEFINKLADKILDIDYGEIREYSGHYDKFLNEKAEIQQQKLNEKKHLEDKIANMQAFVDKFKAKASKARQAQSKLKQIEKIELPDIKHSSRVAPKFAFPVCRPSGKTVLKVDKLSKAYGDKIIFNNVNFSIRRGEKIVIIGANGIGKSTLIKTLMGKITADNGEYEWGAETHINYLSQDHHDLLKDHQNLLNWLADHTSKSTTQEIRNMLGRVLFTKDDHDKDILTLSGGEAARLLLARIMLNPGNILVMDEPTNHMDLESITNLGTALRDYQGTLILVSHNRDLIKHVADRIIFITKDKIIDSPGSYENFLLKHQS
ncbi:MAG: ATP-binding cassette domain-containing protein [Gammaproteobacteria bacterium]|nr:ATP-binding cassette domain-containing protein [Gammaproteobacteria bacterium]